MTAAAAPPSHGVAVPLFLFLEPVSKLDVLAHGAGVGVALHAARVLAGVGLAGDVRLHVLGPVAGVVEPLGAAVVVARVGLLPRVGADVQLEVLQTGETPGALHHAALVGFLPRVAPQVRHQLVAGVERLHVPGAVPPEAAVLEDGERVFAVQVSHEGTKGVERLVAVVPPTNPSHVSSTTTTATIFFFLQLHLATVAPRQRQGPPTNNTNDTVSV